MELAQWIQSIEDINVEIDHLKMMELRFIKSPVVVNAIQGFRRKNALVMGSLCKYEQELKKELQYGKREYDLTRAKEHEKRRDNYVLLLAEFRILKNGIIHRIVGKHL